LLEGYCSCPKRLNEHAIPLARYPRNALGFITYILKLGRVLHSPTKTYKGCNTLSELHYKHHGLNYFGLGYYRGIIHAHTNSMNAHYPSEGIPKIHWVP
jgi:hypothetical protein